MKGYIYSIIDKRIGKVIYIGCTKNFEKRKHEHFYRPLSKKTQPIQKYIREQGMQNFKMTIQIEKDFEDLNEMYKYEAKYIEKYNTFNEGYNYNYGGASTAKGKKNSNARKIICVTTGKTFNCIKDACNKYGIKQVELASHLTRKRYKNGIGLHLLGEPLFFKYLDREKDARVVKKETLEKVRAANKKNCKKVIDLDNNKIFDSIKETAENYNIPMSSLSQLLNYGVSGEKYSHLHLKFLEV